LGIVGKTGKKAAGRLAHQPGVGHGLQRVALPLAAGVLAPWGIFLSLAIAYKYFQFGRRL
jgi:hypothetical protein